MPRTLLRSFARKAQWYPVPLFLVEHASGPFLIDTGYDRSISSEPTPTLGFFFGRVAMKHRLVDPGARDQIVSRGVDPAGISRVVMTHLHNDHASGAGQWPGATFIATRDEREAAAGFGPM